AMLVEGESMLNDAFAIVIFGVLLSLVTTSGGASVTVMGTILKFLMSFFGGIAVGAVLGIVMRYAITLTGSDRLVYVTVSLIIAYLAFVIGEHSLHVSGVIAVMTAGLVVARYNERWLKRSASSYFLGFWEYIAWLANSLIFLLVGLSAAAFFRHVPETEPRLWLWIGYAIVVAVAARGLMVFTTVPLLNQLLPKAAVDRRYQGVIFWGGLRGAVALALVLSLNRDFPHRELLIAMTLGVVLFTVVVGGGTTGWLIRRLKLDLPPLVDQLGQEEAALIARQEMLTALDRIRDVDYVQKSVVDEVKQGYQPALERAQAAVGKAWQQLDATPHLRREALWLTAIELEQHYYRQCSDQGFLSENVFDRLLTLISFKRDAIQEGRIPPPVFSYEDLEKGSDRLRSRIWEYMGAVSWGRRQKQANLEARYEYDIMMRAAAKQVVDGISELAKREALDLKTATKCERAFASIGEQVLVRLQAFESEQPELARSIQERLVKRAGAQTAQEIVNSLASAGVISSKASAKVLSELKRDAI
ncbi:MAG: cation:proton antiporter, partial [Acidiferrobacterales bacterium]